VAGVVTTLCMSAKNSVRELIDYTMYVFMAWARKTFSYYLFSKSYVILFCCLTFAAEVLYFLVILILFHYTWEK